MYCTSIFLHFLLCFSFSIISEMKKSDLLRRLASPSSSTSIKYSSECDRYRLICCWLRKVLMMQRQTDNQDDILTSLPQRVRKSYSSWYTVIQSGSPSPSSSSSSTSVFTLLHPLLRQLMYSTIKAAPVASISLSSSFEQGTWQSPSKMVNILRLNFMARTDVFMCSAKYEMVGYMCCETQVQIVYGSVSLRMAKDLKQQQTISSCCSGEGTHVDPTTRPSTCLLNSPTLSSASRSTPSKNNPNLADSFSTSLSSACSYSRTHSPKPSTLWILCRKEKRRETARSLNELSDLSSSETSRFARNCLVFCFSSGES